MPPTNRISITPGTKKLEIKIDALDKKVDIIFEMILEHYEIDVPKKGFIRRLLRL